MRVIIACAGTGGHINPGIAIANIIKIKEPNSEILFIGTKTGLENELVSKAGFNIKQIRAGRLHRRITIENVKNMYNALVGISDSKKIIKEFKPDVVIGTGGYICVPVMKAAKSLKVKYVLHESNVYPGMAVKVSAKDAEKILVGFEETKKFLNASNVVYTGTPARFDKISIDCLNKLKCKNELKLNIKGKKILFVTGGSQGARRINETVISMIKKYKPEEFYTVLAVGHNNYDSVIKELPKELEKYIRVEKYIFEMDKMYKASDLLITRAGAMTVLELGIAAKPAILIPLPTAAENHQLYNAKVLEQNGAGVVLEEKFLNEDVLYENITKIITDTNTIKKMGEKSRSLVLDNVEEKIYNEIKKCK